MNTDVKFSSSDVTRFKDLVTKIFGSADNKSAKLNYLEKKFGTLPLGDSCEVIYLPGFNLGLLNTDGIGLRSIKKSLLSKGRITLVAETFLHEVYERLCSYISGQEKGEFPGMPCAYLYSDSLILQTMKNDSVFIYAIEFMRDLSSPIVKDGDDTKIIALFNQAQSIYQKVMTTAIHGWVDLLSDIEKDFAEMGI